MTIATLVAIVPIEVVELFAWNYSRENRVMDRRDFFAERQFEGRRVTQSYRRLLIPEILIRINSHVTYLHGRSRGESQFTIKQNICKSIIFYSFECESKNALQNPSMECQKNEFLTVVNIKHNPYIVTLTLATYQKSLSDFINSQ